VLGTELKDAEKWLESAGSDFGVPAVMVTTDAPPIIARSIAPIMSLSSTSTWFGTLLILFGVAFGDVRRIVDLEDAEFKLLLPLGRPRLPI